MYSSTLLFCKLVRFVLIAQGDIKNVKIRRVHKIIVFGAALILLLGSVIGFLTTNSGIVDELTAFVTVSLSFFAVLIVIQMTSSMKNIKMLFLKMESKDPVNRDLVLQYTEILVSKKLIWQLGTMIVTIGFPLTQIILQSLQNKPIAAKYSLLFPFWFSCGELNETRVILKTLCYTVKTNFDLLLVNGLITLLCSIMAIYTIGAIILYAVTIYELSAHVNVFKSKIRVISETMNCKYEAKRNEMQVKKCPLINDGEEIINEHFVPLIEYQQFLKSCVYDIISTWKTYTTSFIINHFITLSVMVFTVLMEKDNAAQLAFRVTGMVIFNNIIFYLICHYGYDISHTNEAIFDELCTIPWYQQNTKFRKLYGFTLTLSRQSDSIKILDIYEVGFHTVEALIRTTYSALNLILVMRNK